MDEEKMNELTGFLMSLISQGADYNKRKPEETSARLPIEFFYETFSQQEFDTFKDRALLYGVLFLKVRGENNPKFVDLCLASVFDEEWDPVSVNPHALELMREMEDINSEEEFSFSQAPMAMIYCLGGNQERGQESKLTSLTQRIPYE